MGKKSRLKKLGVKKNKLATTNATSDFARECQEFFSTVMVPWVERGIEHDEDYWRYGQMLMAQYSAVITGTSIEEGRAQLDYLKRRAPEAYAYTYKTAKQLWNTKQQNKKSYAGIPAQWIKWDKMVDRVTKRLMEWYEPTLTVKTPDTTVISPDACYDELYMMCVKHLHYGVKRDDITVTLYTAARQGNTGPLLALGKQALNPRALEQGYQNAVMLKAGVCNVFADEQYDDAIQTAVQRMVKSFDRLKLIAGFCVHWKKRGLHTLDDRMNRYATGDYRADPTDLPDLLDLFEDIKKHTGLQLGFPYAGLMLVADAYRSDGLAGVKKTIDGMSAGMRDKTSQGLSKFAPICQQVLDPSYCDWMANNRALYLRDVCALFADATLDYLHGLGTSDGSVVDEIIDWKNQRSTAPAKSLSIQSVLDKLGWTD